MTNSAEFEEKPQFELYSPMLNAEASLGGEALAITIFDISAGGARFDSRRTR